MSTLSVPCPHCSQPVALGWDAGGAGNSRVHGRCRSCRGAYRFFKRAGRRAALFIVAFWFVLLLAWLRFQAPCALCDRIRAHPLYPFAPVVAIILFILLTVFVMQAGTRSSIVAAVREGRDYEVLEPVAEKDLPFSEETIRKDPVGAGFGWLFKLVGLGVVIVTMIGSIRALLQQGRLTFGGGASGYAVNETVDTIVYWFFISAFCLSLLVALSLGIAGTVRYVRILRKRKQQLP